MNFTHWIWAHLQTTVFILCMLLRLPLALRYATLAIALAGGLSIVVTAYILPISGWLSGSSFILLLNCVGQNFNWYILLSSNERSLVFRISLILGLILYPASLGLFNYYVYNWGFNSVLFPLILGAGIQLAWWRGYRKLAILGLFILWAWLLNLSASQNLWDYLIDPWLVIYAFYSLEKSLFARQR